MNLKFVEQIDENIYLLDNPDTIIKFIKKKDGMSLNMFTSKLAKEVIFFQQVNRQGCILPKYHYFQLRPNNRIKVLDHIVEFDAYVILENLKGDSLLDRINKGNYDDDQIYEWMKDLMIGIKCLHDNGMVHRGINLESVVVRKDNSLALLNVLGKCGKGNKCKSVETEKLNDKLNVAIVICQMIVGKDLNRNKNIGEIFFQAIKKHEENQKIRLLLLHQILPEYILKNY